ncbi:adenosylmethionine decarboxylase [Vibrio splendidus]|uniref:adenosylmethionine decarboxylase n=1 Tax=Vibrio splendidus TaxID=29497 RepID=UPI0018E410EC|nr:adenosylmethionine decarboxylase [Vibrio splendidus]
MLNSLTGLKQKNVNLIGAAFFDIFCPLNTITTNKYMHKDKNECPYTPGKHVLLDFSGAKNLTDIAYIEKALRKAADICNATVLDVNLHSFGEEAGVTGVALLAESHISIHTWPEIGFAALDVFMCGSCDATAAIAPLEEMFQPSSTNIREIIRGSDKAC